MNNLQNKQGIGIAIAIVGGLVISFDVPVIRLALSDIWMVMVVRGFGLAIALGIVWQFARKYTQTPRFPFADKDWMIVSILYGVANIFFTLAVFTTSTANLVFILAFNPMLAALFGWWLIGEKPNLVTWLAMFATVGGVTLIVGEGLDRGNTLGDFLSLCCAATLAYTLVRTRMSGKDMSLTPGFGGLVSAVFAVPLALYYSSWPGSMSWLIFDGLLLLPVASFCLALAPRFIPAAQVAMFYLIETVLAPLWVWLLFAEAPGNKTLIDRKSVV